MRTFFSYFFYFPQVLFFHRLRSCISPTYTNYQNQTDTSLWFKWKYALTEKLSLPNLQTSSDTFHFRLWTDMQAIDIWTNDNSIWCGTVTNYAQRYNRELYKKGIYQIDKTFSNKITLDSSTARRIFNLLATLNIIHIPTDEKIKGWQQGLDGREYIIELSDKKHYEFKTYWTPSLFADSLIEAKQIQLFVDKLFNEFQVGRYYEKLKLPKGNYRRDGIPGLQIRESNNNMIKNSIPDWL